MEITDHLLCRRYKSASSSQQGPWFTESRASASSSDEQRQSDGQRKKRNIKWKRQKPPRELLTTNQHKPAWLSLWQPSMWQVLGIFYIILIAMATSITVCQHVRRGDPYYSSDRPKVFTQFPWCVAWRCFICIQILLFLLSNESVCGAKTEMHQRVETIFELCGQLIPRWHGHQN